MMDLMDKKDVYGFLVGFENTFLTGGRATGTGGCRTVSKMPYPPLPVATVKPTCQAPRS
jgi:hypothetical protein